MRKTEKKTRRKTYLPPHIGLWQGVSAGESLLSNSLGPRDDYGGGGDGWS